MDCYIHDIPQVILNLGYKFENCGYGSYGEITAKILFATVISTFKLNLITFSPLVVQKYLAKSTVEDTEMERI